IAGRAAVILLTAGALVHPAATLFSRSSWQAELFCHFQFLGLTVTLAALAATLRRHRRVALALTVLAALQTIPLFRYDGPNPVPPDPRSPARLRLLVAN